MGGKIFRILAFLFPALMFFDAGCFVYGSMSPYFALTMTVFVSFALVCIAVCFAGSRFLVFTPAGAAIGLWTVYVVVHGLLSGHPEQYRLMLWVAYGLLFQVAFFIFRKRYVVPEYIYAVFLFYAVIQSVVCLLQYGGFIGSQNGMFAVTGTLENPNITAMFIAACIPYCLFRLTRKSIPAAVVISLLLVVSLVLLQCRTAFIGVGVAGAVFLFSRLVVAVSVKKIPVHIKVVAAAIFLSVLFIVFSFLYDYKKDSADGRRFIWKVSSEMIAEKPLSGYGYGLFEKHYNLRQAEYFAGGRGSDTERRNAGHVNMAYSEIIGQTVEGGFPGLLLYCLFFAAVLFPAFKQREFEVVAVAGGVFCMGAVNFTVEAIPLWVLLLVYAASLLKPLRVIDTGISGKRAVFGMFFVLAVVLAGSQSLRLKAQLSLKNAIALINEGDVGRALVILENNRRLAGTSEAYLRAAGSVYLHKKSYADARSAFEEATRYSSLPGLYFQFADCSIQERKTEKAMECLGLIADMIPQNLRSRYRLMVLYARSGEQKKAIKIAEEILRIEPKVSNDEAVFYKEKAGEYLRGKHSQIPIKKRQ